ncbi:MAG: hypothetical protein ACLVJ6_06075 [Merdibacter sp.]
MNRIGCAYVDLCYCVAAGYRLSNGGIANGCGAMFMVAIGRLADVSYAPLHGTVGMQQPSRPLLKDVVIRQLKLAHAHVIIIADWKRIVPPVKPK